MDKAERFMLFSIVSLVLFVVLTIASSFQGYSILIYGSMVPALVGFLFFLISVHAMGQRDLFEVLGSLIHQTRGKTPKPKTLKSLKPSEKNFKRSQRPVVDKKMGSERISSQTSESPPLPPPPPPPKLDSVNDAYPQSKERDTINCPRCGQKLHERAAFCGRCGMKVRETDTV